MSAYATLRTANDSPHWIWVTIYDLAKTTHLDYGWVKPGTVRPWASGNYHWGSFYYIRAEVKDAPNSDNPPGDVGNLYDTTVQVNPQSAEMFGRVMFDFFTAGLGEAGGGQWTEDVEGSSTMVALKKGDGNYYWDHSN